MLRRVLLLAGLLCVVGTFPLVTAQPPDREKVKRLLEQLADSDEGKQAAAQWALLRMGPEILPLLPKPGARDERLRTVTATLKELLPRSFTLQRARVSLSKALEELTSQTGIPVADRRGTKDDPTFALKGAGLPFWQALDTIAAASSARVSLYQGDGKLALLAAPARRAPQPASYHGMFRTTVKHVGVSRDLETDTHLCIVILEVTWEPRLQPFLLEVGAMAIEFGKESGGKAAAAGKVAVTGRNALEVDLRVAAPPRATTVIDRLRGSFVVTAPSKMLTFAFDQPAMGMKQVQEGVIVRLTDVSREENPLRWEIAVTIENPPGQPSFESYQAALWLENNAIWLEKNGGKMRIVPEALPEVDVKNGSRAVVRYAFTQKGNPGVRFGALSDWTLRYRTPGRMVELPVPYEFKGVSLP